MDREKIIGWTEEMEQFLRDNYGKLSAKDVGAAVGKSLFMVHKRAQKLKIECDGAYIRNGRVCHKWSKEDLDLLIKHHRTKSATELGEMLKGRNWSTIAKKMQVLKLKKRMANYDGKVWIRKTETGAWQVKIFKDGRFQSYSHWLWRQHYGEIPKGKVIVTKDGNPLHCNHLDNLEMINRRLQLYKNNPRLTKDEAIAFDMIAEIKDNMNIKRNH